MPARKSRTLLLLRGGAAGPERSKSPLGRWQIFVIAFAALVVPMVLWALASPLASIPDEPSHAIRAAAVVRGQISTEAWSANTTMGRADVPRYVALMHDRTCYVFKPNLTPACEIAGVGDANEIVTTGTSAGINSPVYYAIVGLPTLFLSGDVALYGMRMVNVLLCAAVLALMFMQLSTLRASRWAIAGTAVAVTPMVLFLAGSINPNAIEAASAGALFVTLVALIRTPPSRRILWERAAIAIVSVGLLVNTRSIALLWVLIIIAAAFAFARLEQVRTLARRPQVWVLLIGSALASFAALWWYAHPPDYGGDVAPAGVSSISAFLTMGLNTFEYSNGLVGIFGWLDSPSPAFSLIVWSVAIGALVVAALVWGAGRARWVAAGFGLVMILTPPITEAIIAPQLGYIWQGRYMLAMFLCLLVACGMALDDGLGSGSTRPHLQDRPRARRAVAVMIALLAAGQVLSFVITARRYAVGVTGPLTSMVAHPLWQPPLGWIPLAVVLSLWAAVSSVILFRAVVFSDASLNNLAGPVSRVPNITLTPADTKRNR